MQKWLNVSISCTAAIVVASAFASVAQATEPVELPRSVVLEHEGAKGVWLPFDMATELQVDVEQLTELRIVVKRQGEQLKVRGDRLQIKDERIKLLRESIELSVRAEKRSADALAAAMRAKRDAEERLDSFWRSPGFLIGVGAVGVVLIEITALAVAGAL